MTVVRKRRARALLPLVLASIAAFLAVPDLVSAHIVVEPASSPVATTQLYTIAVPNEKRSDTVKVEVQFPRALVVLQVQAPAGWRVTPEKDGSGHILGAIWEGGAAGLDEFASFGVLAQNPNGSADLSWSAIQTYADGSEVQWFGPESSQFPATVTRVRDASAELLAAQLVAAAALAVGVSALLATLLLWRRVRRRVPRPTPAAAASIEVGESAPDGVPVALRPTTPAPE